MKNLITKLINKLVNFFRRKTTINIKELAKEYRTQDNVCTSSPIYMVQSLINVGIMNEDYVEETGENFLNGRDEYIVRKFYDSYMCEEFVRERACEILIEEFSEQLSEKETELEESLLEEEELEEEITKLKRYIAIAKNSKDSELFEDPEDEFYSLDEFWENSNEFRSSGLVKYIYEDEAWFLTMNAAKKHMQAKNYRYTKPRVYVKSLYNSWELRGLLEQLGLVRR
jgi:hypothetical protein